MAVATFEVAYPFPMPSYKGLELGQNVQQRGSQHVAWRFVVLQRQQSAEAMQVWVNLPL